MQHPIVAAAFVSALALSPVLVACASDDDPVSTENATTDTSSDSTASDTTSPADAADPDISPSLTLSAEPPPDASVSVTTDRVVEDRILRRGSQPEIEQGQTFLIGDDTTLTSVSFQVVPSGEIASGQAFELAIYDVGNLSTMVPSNVVDLGIGADRLVVTSPAPLDDGTPIWLTFSLPGVDLTGGATYAAVVSLADGGAPASLFVQHVDDDRYADGTAIFLEGANWKAYDGNGDTVFALTFV